MLTTINKSLEKMMPFITPVSVILGVIFSAYLKDYSFLIPWIFAFMSFSGSLGSNFHSFKEAFFRPVPMLIALSILHVLMPLYAWGMGHLIFTDDIFTITGLILGMAIPTGITSLIWASIYKGNVSLTLSIILIDTILSPILVPFTISLIVGQKIEMNVWSMMTGLLGMVVIPSLFGMAINHWTKGRVKESWSPSLAPFSKIGIGFVVMLNGAVVAPYLKEVNAKLFTIVLVVWMIALSGYILSFLFGKILRQNRDTVVALTFTGGMRNISAGAVLATSYFPPAVAVPVVIGMLFQQVLAALSGYMLNRHYNQKHEQQPFSE